MNSNKKNIILLLTGTIVPYTIESKHNNILLRKNEYISTIKYYLETVNVDIIFAENSSFDIYNDEDFISLLKNKKLNIIKTKIPSLTAVQKGKGYQEFQMLNEILTDLGNDYVGFYKVTGRYKIININRFLNDINHTMVIDCHKIIGVAKTDFFYCNIDFYKKELMHAYLLANDMKLVFIENVLYEIIKELCSKKNICTKLLKFSPKIVGITGTSGHIIKRNRLILFLRNVERKVLRKLDISEFHFEYPKLSKCIL